MTEREALKLALEALQKIYIAPEHEEYIRVWWPACEQAITAIKEALAQPEQEPTTKAGKLRAMKTELWKQPEQEPVAWAKFSAKGNIIDLLNEPDDDYTPLYTTPPQRTWVGLTDEERKDTLQSVNTGFVVDASVVALAIEAKLKEKNT